MSAKDKQIGGLHYKNFAIQPVDFIQRNNLGFLEGCVIKRMCRWQNKNGIEDLRKAIHEIELLIEHTEQESGSWNDVPMSTVPLVPAAPNYELNTFYLNSRTPAKALKAEPNGTPVSVWGRVLITGRRGRPRMGWVDTGFVWNGELVPHETPR